MKPGSATTTLVVKSTVPDRRVVVLDGKCTDASGSIIASAVLEVEPSSFKVRQATAEHCLDRLVDECRGLKPILTGVVYPCSAGALGGAIDAAKVGLITPVLFGPEKEIKEVAAKANLDISGFKIVDVFDPAEAAHRAAIAAGSGEIQALMKGSLHTDVLLHAVLDKEAKLRTGRLLSHCALISAPQYARRVVVTDAALNIAPDTNQKRDICQNAIGFAAEPTRTLTPYGSWPAVWHLVHSTEPRGGQADMLRNTKRSIAAQSGAALMSNAGIQVLILYAPGGCWHLHVKLSLTLSSVFLILKDLQRNRLAGGLTRAAARSNP